MKAYGLSAFLLLAAVISLAQTTTNTAARRFDVNGNPIDAGSVSESKTAADGRVVRTEYGVDANGQKIPLTSLEEMKVEQNGRIVIQRVIKQYDRNGNPTSSERVISEEQKLGETSSEKKTTVYRTDLNGNESVDELAVTKTNGKTSVTNVEKRAFDGTLALAERQTTTTETKPNGSKSESTTFRPDNNGSLLEVAKEVHETTKQGNQTVENDAKFVLRGDGQYALQEQTVTRATPHADGTVSKTIELYGEQVSGVTNESGRPALKEIQTVQSRKAADGTVVETTVSQKAEVNDNGRLSSPQVISETVTAKKANQ